MNLQISHQTHYRYEGKVSLSPHSIRLFPRIPGRSHLLHYQLVIDPPGYLRWSRDAFDNDVAVFNFFGQLETFSIDVQMHILTLHKNPFDFVLNNAAEVFPPQWSAGEAAVLKPQAVPQTQDGPVIRNFLAGQGIEVSGSPLEFLLSLNQCLRATLTYTVRMEEGTRSPEETLRLGGGTCRDFAWLFVEAVRNVGFAARLVSGYLATGEDDDSGGSLHAWAEVFLPGAGWVGFDPTNGVLADDAYVPTTIGWIPNQVLPVEGTYFSSTPVQAQPAYDLKIRIFPEDGITP